MRVLHLSWEYPPLVYGGLGRHVHALAEAQAAAGHDVVVVTQHPGAEDVPSDEVVRGVRVVRAPHDPPVVEMSDFLAWVVSLEHALTRRALALGEQWRPDVVHAHDWVVAHAAATLRQAWRVAVVATVHATEAGLLLPRYRPMANLPMVNSTAVTAAPIQTSRQAIFTSGRYFSSTAKATVITTSEMARLRI